MNSKESDLLVCAKTKIPCINNGARDFCVNNGARDFCVT